MPIVTLQRKFMELGRLRMGDKAGSGAPRKLTEWRLTSASQELLEAAAAIYGGAVQPWTGAPDEGYFELYTTSSVLDVWLPPVFADADGAPTYSWSQWYELWSGGGCQRRCDGATEMLTNQPCLCVPHARECKETTRVNVILWQLPGVGVWRLESHGYNAATMLPATFDLLQRAASQGEMIDAKLRIEQRTRKVPGEGTRKFIVPVLDVPGLSLGELMGADNGPKAINAPAPIDKKRPELPAVDVPAPEPDKPFLLEQPQPEWGATIEPETGDELEARELRLAILDLVEGDKAVADAAIFANRQKHGDDLSKHLTWLRGQKTRALNARKEQEG